MKRIKRDGEIIYKVKKDTTYIGTAEELVKMGVFKSRSSCYLSPKSIPIARRYRVYALYKNNAPVYSGTINEIVNYCYYSESVVEKAAHKGIEFGRGDKYSLDYVEQREIPFE